MSIRSGNHPSVIFHESIRKTRVFEIMRAFRSRQKLFCNPNHDVQSAGLARRLNFQSGPNKEDNGDSQLANRPFRQEEEYTSHRSFTRSVAHPTCSIKLIWDGSSNRLSKRECDDTAGLNLDWTPTSPAPLCGIIIPVG